MGCDLTPVLTLCVGQSRECCDLPQLNPLWVTWRVYNCALINYAFCRLFFLNSLPPPPPPHQPHTHGQPHAVFGRFISHKTLDIAQPCHLLKPHWKPSSSHSTGAKWVNMYDVSIQGIDERVTNVDSYFYYSGVWGLVGEGGAPIAEGGPP